MKIIMKKISNVKTGEVYNSILYYQKMKNFKIDLYAFYLIIQLTILDDIKIQCF